MNDISRKIYESTPKKPKSIQIEFDQEELNSSEELNKKIFKMLLEIFYDGMRKFNLKDNQVNLKELSDEDFMKLREYFWSIGFDVFYIVKINDVEVKNTNTLESKSDLKAYYLDLKIDEYLFTISFDYL